MIRLTQVLVATDVGDVSEVATDSSMTTARRSEHEFVVTDAADTTANKKPGGLS
jgi:hypothetical protein